MCKVREELYYQRHNDYLTRIHFLENQIKVEKAEKELIQDKLFTVLRINTAPQIMREEMGGAKKEKPTHIRGVESPMKQRAAAEIESRRKYWAEKAEASSVIDNVGSTT